MVVLKRVLVYFIAIAYGLVSTVGIANAKMIDTAAYVVTSERQRNIEIVNAALLRDDVRMQLVAHGVDPDQARMRAASLSDAELNVLAREMESLPAGGDVLAVIGVVFIVLLILELTGVIDIFKRT